MTLQLDHLVHGVVEPEKAAAEAARRFGWRTVPGGRHVDWGTFNHLSYFDGCYLEWVSVFDAKLAHTTEFGKWVAADLERGEGIQQMALRTRRMDELVAAWRTDGLPFVGPIPGRRQRPDGSWLRWRLLFPVRSRLDDFPLPFLIEWEDDDAAREAALVASGALAEARAERPQWVAVESLVADPAALTQVWNRWFGRAGAEMKWQSEVGQAVVESAGPLLVFRAPATAAEAEVHRRRGDRPAILRVAAPAASESHIIGDFHGVTVVQSFASKKC
ncbi:hypothetical protein GCM10025857_24470 [Alicyclobacillus contaminans]|uniref:VOC family protein n=1 Tax=Alicyclobacillus contaminans TaxID=392016 RepID=UPI00041E053E|nr:VOC family protein [Alicyclobacillus contaminans]GMA51090.1 hypothetical protein GCM10025857_24470 [Alicyclobacillus contaminans]